jgi:SAM-dependent methyltransferase
MSYEPRRFWEERLSGHFDLRGTGEPGLSLAYNRACYALRRRVLDVGSGVGFFVDYYLKRGARVTGVDLAAVAVEGLRRRFPTASFLQADVSDLPFEPRYLVVNVFDVLFHITDDDRWERALAHLCGALAPGGLLLVTDPFAAPPPGTAPHNVARPLDRYRAVLSRGGVAAERLYPTHVLLNRELGFWRFLNRAPGLLYAIDRAVLALGYAGGARTNRLLVARRAGPR